jgi:hypothetical protein
MKWAYEPSPPWTLDERRAQRGRLWPIREWFYETSWWTVPALLVSTMVPWALIGTLWEHSVQCPDGTREVHWSLFIMCVALLVFYAQTAGRIFVYLTTDPNQRPQPDTS